MTLITIRPMVPRRTDWISMKSGLIEEHGVKEVRDSHKANNLLCNFINGEYRNSRNKFRNINPANGEDVSEVYEASREMVEEAVSAARAALAGPWARTSVTDRIAILRRVADAIEENTDLLLEAEIADTGKPRSLALSLDIARASMNFRAFADQLTQIDAEAFYTELADGRRALNYVHRRPLGVVGIIVPWNLPLLLLTWKLAPALAAGNSVVVKPSEETPTTATLLAKILQDSGVPDGVYNVVHGFGPGSAGEFLTQADIDGITFTGETRTGSAIMRTVADRVIPVSFELGGKNAAVVFDDADLDTAIPGLLRSSYTNTGQVCLCTERIYVQRTIFDEVARRMSEGIKAFRFGDPMLESTSIGPLISAEHKQKVLSYFELAKRDGVTILAGGSCPEVGEEFKNGHWVEPTLLTNVAHDSPLLNDEVFGPVAVLVPFDTEEEAISMANSTQYGLAASVWTRDIQRGHEVAQRMKVGLSWVNTWYLRDLRSPFGGVGASGIGREGGQHSMNFYSEPTNVCVQLRSSTEPMEGGNTNEH